MCRTVIATLFALLGHTAACSQAPLDIPCPFVDEGDLVLTEIRGPQSGEDGYGEWLEIYNPTSQSIDLSGLSVVVYKLDGSQLSELLVRSPISLESGSYAVLGRQLRGMEPSHVDYGYVSDIDRNLYDSAAVELRSCGERVDLVVYRNLPSKGTLTLSGEVLPTSEANDDELNWCADQREDEESEDKGLRGSPQEENPSCEP